MTVQEIVAQWLEKEGFDGLYSEGACACLWDDIAPCGDCKGDNCAADGDCNFHITGDKDSKHLYSSEERIAFWEKRTQRKEVDRGR